MQFIINIVIFSFVMGVIVFVHELGHFLAAKKFGVYCNEFAIGMGPKVFSFQKNETTYTIRALPLGGFVAMAGEADNLNIPENIPFERTINGINKIKKIIVLIAGIVMNFLLAFIIYIGIYLAQGSARVDGPIKVEAVVENSNAAHLGLKTGDEITDYIINNKTITIKDMNAALTSFVIEDVSHIMIKRGNEIIKLQYPSTKLESFSGSQLSPNIKKITKLESIPYALKKLATESTTVFKTLSNLIRGKGLQHISGPVGIFNVVGNAAERGIMQIMALIAVLSINIGLFNALPIPALDGGRILLTIFEKILGNKYNKKIENILIIGSFLLLLLLIVFVTFNDITRLIK